MFDDPYLSKIVHELNCKGPAAEELRQLVAEWQHSSSLKAMLSSKSTRFQSACSRAWTVMWIASGKDGHSDFLPTPGHIPARFLRPLPRTIPRLSSGPSAKAVRLFVALTLHPNGSKLAGPCERCGNYYIRNTKRKRVYCSRICGPKATARTWHRRQREQKLRLALAVLKRLGPTNENWKQLVSARHSEITPKFLTRAVGEAARDAGRGRLTRAWNAKEAAGLLGALLEKLFRQDRSRRNTRGQSRA